MPDHSAPSSVQPGDSSTSVRLTDQFIAMFSNQLSIARVRSVGQTSTVRTACDVLMTTAQTDAEAAPEVRQSRHG
jgi:hypothetical protein